MSSMLVLDAPSALDDPSMPLDVCRLTSTTAHIKGLDVLPLDVLDALDAPRY
jgi:hypothetical protein